MPIEGQNAKYYEREKRRKEGLKRCSCAYYQYNPTGIDLVTNARCRICKGDGYIPINSKKRKVTRTR